MDNTRINSYYFTVEIDGIEGAKFKKCEGLESSVDILEIEEGGYNTSTRKFIGAKHTKNIILENGISNNNDLYNWYFYTNLWDNERERKSGSIVLKDLANIEIKRWNFHRAFPCRWIGPSLVAGLHGEYAIEKVEVAIDELQLDGYEEENQTVDNGYENEENMQAVDNEHENGEDMQVVDNENEVAPHYFTQGQWANEFGRNFANNACTATSLLNEVSEEYTMQTGTAMTLEQGAAAIRAAINNGGINPNNANVDNWQNAETGMWNSTGLPGSLQHNEQSTEHIIYAENTDDNPDTAEHFVNSSNNGEYFDPWDGNTGSVEDLDLQQGRPRRGFDYVPPENAR